MQSPKSAYVRKYLNEEVKDLHYIDYCHVAVTYVNKRTYMFYFCMWGWWWLENEKKEEKERDLLIKNVNAVCVYILLLRNPFCF